jgi:Flp pilus assembly protein TadG
MNFLKDRRGVAAVEMALISPFLIMGLLLMLDAGVAVKKRLDLDHSTRTGAQAVMSNINETDEISNLVLAASHNSSEVTVTVLKTCSCSGTPVSCNSYCSATVPPSVFMNITAARQHTGFLLPPFKLESQTNVQIR